MNETTSASLMKMCKENEIILREGEHSEEMYKLLSGKAAMYLHYGEENQYLIGYISDQGCFGDVSLLTKLPNPYTVVATTNVMLMRIRNTQFEEFIVNNTKNAVDIMTNMANMIVTLNKDIDLITDELSGFVTKLNAHPETASLTDDITAMQGRIMKYKTESIVGEQTVAQ